jgi:hypothetical protein
VTAAPKKADDRKKLIFLAALLLVAGVVLYINVFSGDSGSSGALRPANQPAATTPSSGPVHEATRRDPGRTSFGEFKPRLGPLSPEDRVDPATIDPTLRLDLLAKIQAVEPEQALRNIFQYGAAAPLAPPKPVALPTNPPRINVNNTPPPSNQARPGGPANPSAPQAPQMTFKYYGFKLSKATGRREAFLLDGDDIIIAGENDAVKGGRYRIVRIGPTTITIEDTQFKANQTLTLQEEPSAA